MSATGTISISKQPSGNSWEHTLAFNEERLESFRSIREKFTRLFDPAALQLSYDSLTRSFDDYIDGTRLYHLEYYAEKEWKLSDVIDVNLFGEDIDRVIAKGRTEIAAFEEFLESRHQKHSIGEKEEKLISRIKQAIANFREYACFHFYNRFREELSAYFNWLNKKLYKQEQYTTFLFRLRSMMGFVMDGRRRLRNILRLRCHVFSDEDGGSDQYFLNMKQAIFWITLFHHGHRKFKTSILGYQRGPAFRRLAISGR